jgi:hypothetical protein
MKPNWSEKQRWVIILNVGRSHCVRVRLPQILACSLNHHHGKQGFYPTLFQIALGTTNLNTQLFQGRIASCRFQIALLSVSAAS